MSRECELETCRNSFESTRSDARYCSASCRSTASRRRRASRSTQRARTTPTTTKRQEALTTRLRDDFSELRGRIEVVEAREDADTSSLRRAVDRIQRELEDVVDDRSDLEARLGKMSRGLTKLAARVSEVADVPTERAEERPPREDPTVLERLDRLEKQAAEAELISEQVLLIAKRVAALR